MKRFFLFSFLLVLILCATAIPSFASGDTYTIQGSIELNENIDWSVLVPSVDDEYTFSIEFSSDGSSNYDDSYSGFTVHNGGDDHPSVIFYYNSGGYADVVYEDGWVLDSWRYIYIWDDETLTYVEALWWSQNSSYVMLQPDPEPEPEPDPEPDPDPAPDNILDQFPSIPYSNFSFRDFLIYKDSSGSTRLLLLHADTYPSNVTLKANSSLNSNLNTITLKFHTARSFSVFCHDYTLSFNSWVGYEFSPTSLDDLNYQVIINYSSILYSTFDISSRSGVIYEGIPDSKSATGNYSFEGDTGDDEDLPLLDEEETKKKFYEAWNRPTTVFGIMGTSIKEVLVDIFVPDRETTDAMIISLSNRITSKLNLPITSDDWLSDKFYSSPVTNKEGLYSVPGVGDFNLTFFDASFFNEGVIYFRPIIRGFVGLMLIFYHYKQILSFIGQDPHISNHSSHSSNSSSSSDLPQLKERN